MTRVKIMRKDEVDCFGTQCIYTSRFRNYIG